VLRRLTVPEVNLFCFEPRFSCGLFTKDAFFMSIRGFVGFSVIADLGILGEFWTAVLAVCRVVGLAIVASHFFFEKSSEKIDFFESCGSIRVYVPIPPPLF